MGLVRLDVDALPPDVEWGVETPLSNLELSVKKDIISFEDMIFVWWEPWPIMYLFCYQQKVSNHIYTSHNSNAVILLYSENLANNGKNQSSHLHTFIIAPEVLNYPNPYILINLILFFPFQLSLSKLEKSKKTPFFFSLVCS